MMTDEYKQISCAAYDTYEIAIMRHQLMDIAWEYQGTKRRETLKPLDLRIIDKAEYLIAQTRQMETINIRLDWIRLAVILS